MGTSSDKYENSHPFSTAFTEAFFDRSGPVKRAMSVLLFLLFLQHLVLVAINAPPTAMTEPRLKAYGFFAHLNPLLKLRYAGESG